jgi:molecular chaperone GrpE
MNDEEATETSADGEPPETDVDEDRTTAADIDADAEGETATETESETKTETKTNEDTTADTDESSPETGARVEELKAALAEREDRIEELEAKLKRKQADFQNYKKRAERKREQLRERATEDLVERLLDVRDDLRRAIENDHPDVGSLKGGLGMVTRKFDRVLEEENVSTIEPDPGADIDPERHEVMMRVDSEQPEDTVADLYAPGYEMADRVVRAAQVTVSTGSPDPEPDETGGEGETETETETETEDENPPTATPEDGEGD